MEAEIVWRVGMGILGVTAFFGVMSIVVLKLGKRKLHHQLTEEYGERRR